MRNVGTLVVVGAIGIIGIMVILAMRNKTTAQNGVTATISVDKLVGTIGGWFGGGDKVYANGQTYNPAGGTISGNNLVDSSGNALTYGTD